MRNLLKGLGLFSGLLVCATAANAANSVVIESKTVNPAATNVTVGVHVTNDVGLWAVVLPLEFRSVTAGSYITGSLSAGMGGRIGTFIGFSGGFSPDQRSVPSSNVCSGPISHSFPAGYSPVDFISPDCAFLQTVFVNYGQTLPPGTDGAPGTGTPSYTLTFDVTCESGQFVVDTCCVGPANHASFVNSTYQTVPVTFTRGIITIDSAGPQCVCNDAPGDVNCDGVIDVFDVIAVSEAAFSGAPTPSPCCVP